MCFWGVVRLVPNRRIICRYHYRLYVAHSTVSFVIFQSHFILMPGQTAAVLYQVPFMYAYCVLYVVPETGASLGLSQD